MLLQSTRLLVEMRLATRHLRVLLLFSIFVIILTPASPATAADGCSQYPSFGNIAGSRDTAVLSGRGAARCEPSSLIDIARENLRSSPYYTDQIVCSTDLVQASAGVCSVTPCSSSFFAVRTIHYPDGTAEPAGFRCVTLGEALARPVITVADVFEAVRRVKLPGGGIGVTPDVRGLANLESFFWLEGANQGPVDLRVGGSTVHAEFRVAEYRWEFGDGRGMVTTEPGRPGVGSEVRTAFQRRGFYRVGVTVMWVAEAWLDGRRVGGGK
jgi:hypothetical protein